MVKTLILVVAYNAERHIVPLLPRIPVECVNSDDYHILYVDDSSSDSTATSASGWFRSREISNATVIRNPVNQGYGGNQKLGYRYAIDQGYDLVIMLHGDNQYAPEILPRFVDVFRKTKAGVILGSRMQNIKQAATGGMPYYKIVSNRALTAFQNFMTGCNLSEYHTGYRAYSTEFLKSVPFEINTNDFHFDTEILFQAFSVNERIEEFSIPTHYGDEICYVNGPRYALDVILTTFRYRFHQWGMLCSLKYRDLRSQRYSNKTQALYTSHATALDIVRQNGPCTLLDVGCGRGFVARRCTEMGIRVTGIDRIAPEPGSMVEHCVWDLEQIPLPVDIFSFDVVLMLDIIEHLSCPEDFMVALRNNSGQSTRHREPPLLVLTTPNIAFLGIRLNLLFGRFNYAERGILDIDHKRLFTRSSFRTLLEDCGYRIERIKGIGVPFEAVISGLPSRVLGAVSDFMAWLWPSLFAFQILVLCRPMPGVRQLLADSETHLGPLCPGKSDLDTAN